MGFISLQHNPKFDVKADGVKLVGLHSEKQQRLLSEILLIVKNQNREHKSLGGQISCDNVEIKAFQKNVANILNCNH